MQPTNKQLKIELTNLFNRTFPTYTNYITLKNIEIVKIQVLGLYTEDNPRINFIVNLQYLDGSKWLNKECTIHLEEYRGTFIPEEDIPSLYDQIKTSKTIGGIVPSFLLPQREDATDLDALLFLFR